MQNVINAKMIAPCGLDCSICKRALAETNPARDVSGRMRTNRNSAGTDAGSFSAANGSKTAISTVTNVRIIPARM